MELQVQVVLQEVVELQVVQVHQVLQEHQVHQVLQEVVDIRSSGSSGSSGTSGTSGSSGSSGTSGISVGGCFDYDISTNGGTPSSGEATVNSTSSFTVTTIKIHKTDNNGNDNSVQFNALLNNGGSLQVNYNNLAITWYNVTSGTLSSRRIYIYSFLRNYYRFECRYRIR